MTKSRSLSLALALALAAHQASAFSTTQSTTPGAFSSSALKATTVVEDRRAILSSFCSLMIPNAAYAGLLDDYGTDPAVEKQPVKKEQAKNKGKAESALEPNLRSNYYYPTNKVRYLPRIKKCSDAIPGAAEAIGVEDWDAGKNIRLCLVDRYMFCSLFLYTSLIKTQYHTNQKYIHHPTVRDFATVVADDTILPMKLYVVSGRAVFICILII